MVNTRELMHVLSVLGDEENIRFTVQSSAKGAAIAGLGAFVGGILGGPVGLPVGAAIGGFIGMKTNSTFKPLSEIIQRDLSEYQQEQLKERVVKLIKDINIMDAVQLMVMLQADKMLMQVVVKESVKFITEATSAALTNS